MQLKIKRLRVQSLNQVISVNHFFALNKTEISCCQWMKTCRHLRLWDIVGSPDKCFAQQSHHLTFWNRNTIWWVCKFLSQLKLLFAAWNISMVTRFSGSSIKEWMKLAILCACAERPLGSALPWKTLYMRGRGVIHTAWVTPGPFDLGLTGLNAKVTMWIIAC